MVELAFLIGIFGYLVLGLGLIGKLGGLGVLGVLGGLGLLGVWTKKKAWKNILVFWQALKKDKISFFLTVLLLLQALVNLVGVLGPELGFDALWYHLTLPKIYLQSGKIFFIPGNLFYYSAMPRLTEMLYLVTLFFTPGGILAKVSHLTFGFLAALALYFLAKRYLSRRWSLLTVLVFYSSLIVGWESISAYVDLARTFFEILALSLFLSWGEKEDWGSQGKVGLLIESAVMLGLAVSTKLLALASLPVFLILILIYSRKKLFAFYYLLFTLLIPLPWFIFSFIHTGNPVFPVFSGILDQAHNLVLTNPLQDLWQLFYQPQDPISPVFLIFLPVLVLGGIGQFGLIGKYVGLSLFFWYLTPKTGGARFILPYLPAWSLLLGQVFSKKPKFWQKTFLVVCCFSALINISYRFLANKKFLPVILGQVSQDQFLEKYLNFDFQPAKLIGKEDLVLIYGGHNLFYYNFNFIHDSYVKKKTYFSYILTDDAQLPPKFRNLRNIYSNPKTKVNLYIFGEAWP